MYISTNSYSRFEIIIQFLLFEFYMFGILIMNNKFIRYYFTNKLASSLSSPHDIFGQ